MPEIPSLLDLLKAGVHFGHTASKRHPKMSPYIFTVRGDVHLINLELTQKKLEEALNFVKKLGQEGKIILFIGTKKQAQEIVKKYALEADLPYVVNKWLGGTFTNFAEIHRLISKYLGLKDKQARGELAKYTKKEQVDFTKEIGKMEGKIGGISTLSRLPDAVFIVDIKYEKTALEETYRKKIPVVALCDTNSDPSKIGYPIPANDDAVKSIELMVRLVAEAYKEGKASKAEEPLSKPVDAKEIQ